MHVRNRSVRGLAATAVTACALIALMATPALAAPASWSPQGATKWAGSFTVKLNGGSAKTCTPSPAGGAWTGSTNTAYGPSTVMLSPSPFFDAYVYATCTGPTQLSLVVHGNATNDSGTYRVTLQQAAAQSQGSPYGLYLQNGQPVGTYVNGSGGTPSTVTFTNQTLGTTAAGTITITGTLQVTTGTGGLMSLI
jgi:hypothetical protein